jgi:hypothetical protein
MQEVTSETAEQYANEIGALYLETSAKDDTNVHDIFVQLSKWDTPSVIPESLAGGEILICCFRVGKRLPPPPENSNASLGTVNMHKPPSNGPCC